MKENGPHSSSEELSRNLADARALLARSSYREAAEKFSDAWAQLPQPHGSHPETLPLLTGWANACFGAKQFEECRDRLLTAFASCPEAAHNAELRFRLGQAYYELDDQQNAAEWMIGAYLIAPRELFQKEAPKYLEFVKSRLTRG